MIIRNVSEQDYEKLQRLAVSCPPLGVHTAFTYWVISRYQNRFSFVAENNGSICGMLIAITSGDDSSIFVWQIGVAEEFRGQDLAIKMLGKLIKAALDSNYHIFEVTISSENQASLGLFEKLADIHGSKLEKISELNVEDSQYKHKDTENIYRIKINIASKAQAL